TTVGDRFSVQVDIPFATGLSSIQFVDAAGTNTASEFGNMSVWLKGLAWQSDTGALSGGLGLNVPTAEDVKVFAASGAATPLALLRHPSFPPTPSLAALSPPADRFFVQGFAQLDFDLNGNALSVNRGGRLTKTGTLYSSTLLYLSAGAGYRVYENDGGW